MSVLSKCTLDDLFMRLRREGAISGTVDFTDWLEGEKIKVSGRK